MIGAQRPSEVNPGSARLRELEQELAEVSRLWPRFVEVGKRAYYSVRRPADDFLSRRRLSARCSPDASLSGIDRYLRDEGGMFKSVVYRQCEKFVPLRGTSVLVPGAGYGRNILRLATFRPLTVFAFDPFEYGNEWEFVAKAARDRFGTRVEFGAGDWACVPACLQRRTDVVASDAVLEHVSDLDQFATHAADHLRDGGLFYASFGPLWYGPGGDHIDWGDTGVYNHLLLPPLEYERLLEDASRTSKSDSCDGYWMVKHSAFSRLKASEYLAALEGVGLKRRLAFAKISFRAINVLARTARLDLELDNLGSPEFDRVCSGMYVWMTRQVGSK